MNSSKSSLEKSIASLNSEKSSIAVERDKLANEVRRLTRQESDNDNQGTLWQKMTAASRELRRAEDEASAAKINNGQLEEENKKLCTQLSDITAKCKTFESLAADGKIASEANVEANIKLEVLKNEHQLMSNQLTASELARHETIEKFSREMEKLLIEKKLFQTEIQQLKDDINAEKEDKKTSIDKFEETGELPEGIGADAFSSGIIEILRKKLAVSEEKRRKLHNQLQDLRGNVRVYVRCRPFLKCDGEETEVAKSCLDFHPEGNSLSFASGTKGAGQSFAFDSVLPMTATQDHVYDGISELLQSSLDGYRVCVFSYGQTGSGKTHTMTGCPGNEGVIPRSVRHILKNSIDLQESNSGWKVSLKASIVELYNEELKDLLCNSSSKGEKLKISFDQGKVNVAGLTYDEFTLTDIDSGMDQLNRLLAQSTKARTTACTGMNEHSSRSHCVFMLDVVCKHTNGQVMEGGLKLVDLAGSERLSRTGTLNDSVRLKETVNINKSLSSLSDVFMALGKKNSHVPYRNSKLTLLLQDCLSGDGKALMFVNVSPTFASSQETLCSLRFANQVSQVELGKAQKNAYIVKEVQVPVSAPPVQHGAHASVDSHISLKQSTSEPSTKFSRRGSMLGLGAVGPSRSMKMLAAVQEDHQQSSNHENQNNSLSLSSSGLGGASRRTTKRDVSSVSHSKEFSLSSSRVEQSKKLRGVAGSGYGQATSSSAAKSGWR